MIDYINETLDQHIITVEEPIEYYHNHKKSIINQREVGLDVPTFSEALRRSLRQDPDVILVGEMRDLETIESAITAAETGHLVFATLHTTGCQGTINRIIDAFPVSQQEQIRVQLSTNLIAVLSQILCPKKTGKGRVAAYEFMVVTPAIANLIRENKTYRIESSIQIGKNQGMQLLDDHLWELYEKDLITIEEMLDKSRYPSAMLEKAEKKAGTSLGAAKKTIEEEYGPILKT
jgi:twitching motility protein PilT